MSIRFKLDTDESIDGNFEQLILGRCCGTGLSKRGPDDDHICFTILMEDDEYWFPTKHSWSSYWIDDMIEVSKATKEWLEKNAVPDIVVNKYVPEGYQCGWRFKR